MIFILGVHQGLRPPTEEKTTVTDSNGNRITTYHHCSFDELFCYIIVSFLGVIAILITKFAYDVRDTPLQFNEARELGLALYTVILAGLIGVPLMIFFQNNNEYQAKRATIAFLQAIVPAIIILTLFGKRLFHAIRGRTVEDLNQNIKKIARVNSEFKPHRRSQSTSKRLSEHFETDQKCRRANKMPVYIQPPAVKRIISEL